MHSFRVRWFKINKSKKDSPTTGSEETFARSLLADPALASRSTLLVHALYQSAFGRLADSVGLTGYLEQLNRGASVETLAKSLTRSEEFRIRRGSSQRIDFNFIVDLYRDTFARHPAPEELSRWLGEGERGCKRTKMVAALAESEEALKRLRSVPRTSDERYGRWVATYDTLNQSDRAAIRLHIAELPYQPFISIILVSEDHAPGDIRSSLASLEAQLYTSWELGIAGHLFASSIMEEAFADQVRPKLVHVGGGATLSERANTVLKMTKARFVAFLRAGDVLSEHALYEVVVGIGHQLDLDIIYSDRDQIDKKGRRSNPWFKPGWDPDLLLTQNYLNDLTVYRRELIQKVGGLRDGLDGAEFYDLAVRATAATASDRIQHIPAILYHECKERRVLLAESRTEAVCQAMGEHLSSAGYSRAKVQTVPNFPGAVRVIWPLPDEPPLVSVIIPTRDRGDLVARCVHGLLHRTNYTNLEILIVDNGSVELESLNLFERLIKKDGRIKRLSSPGPFNYSALNNFGAREAKGEILLLLNNDIEVIESGWLRELVSQAIRPDVGMVGAKLLYANGKVQHAGLALGPNGHATHLSRFASKSDPGYFGQLALPRTLSAVTAACLAIRRKVWTEVGGFDEANLPVLFNDIDLCLRTRALGYRVVWTPFAELIHLESASRSLDLSELKKKRFAREWRHMRERWPEMLGNGDPYHNPNILFHPNYDEIPSVPRRTKPWDQRLQKAFPLSGRFTRYVSSGPSSVSV